MATRASSSCCWRPGRVERRARAALARAFVVLAQHGDDDVAVAAHAGGLVDGLALACGQGRGQQLRVGPARVDHVAALGVAHLGAAREVVAQALEHVTRSRRLGPIAALHEVVLVGQGTGHEHAAHAVATEGQEAALVLEQHERLGLHAAHEVEVALHAAHGVGGLGVGHVGMVEQAQAELHGQYLATRRSSVCIESLPSLTSRRAARMNSAGEEKSVRTLSPASSTWRTASS